MLALFVFVFTVFGLPACSDKKAPQAYHFEGAVMGTQYHVTVVAADMDEPAVSAMIDRTLKGVDSAMTTYQTDSELMQLNAASTDAWIAVSEALYSVLSTSRRVYELTEGAFDPSVGRLVRLWGFGPDDVARIPDPQAITEALATTGFQYLELDEAQVRVRKLRDMELDLSAVAKGYAVDAVAIQLQAAGFHDYLVEVGGELRVKGRSPRGDAWRVAIEQPGLLQGQVHAAIQLDTAAMATSGDYRNFRDFNGERYSHELDPASGRPAQNSLVSVTVIAAECASADALATGLMAMGADKARALALREQLPVYMMVRNGEALDTWHSPAFSAYLEPEVSP